jgi:hypothetical protein
MKNLEKKITIISTKEVNRNVNSIVGDNLLRIATLLAVLIIAMIRVFLINPCLLTKILRQAGI